MNLAGRRAGSTSATAPDLVPWRNLAAAVLLRAVEDARGDGDGVRDAREFLASDGAAWLAAELGLSAGRLEALRADLPVAVPSAAEQRQLAFFDRLFRTPAQPGPSGRRVP